jgi:hypothetical protein
MGNSVFGRSSEFFSAAALIAREMPDMVAVVVGDRVGRVAASPASPERRHTQLENGLRM